MKKIIAIILSVVMIASLIAVGGVIANAATPTFSTGTAIYPNNLDGTLDTALTSSKRPSIRYVTKSDSDLIYKKVTPSWIKDGTKNIGATVTIAPAEPTTGSYAAQRTKLQILNRNSGFALTFNYEVSIGTGGSVKIDDNVVTEAGSYIIDKIYTSIEVELASGAQEGADTSITLTGFRYFDEDEPVAVTVNAALGGMVVTDLANIGYGDGCLESVTMDDVVPADGTGLIPVPDEGYEFFGFVDENGSKLTTSIGRNGDLVFYPTKNTIMTPVFQKPNNVYTDAQGIEWVYSEKDYGWEVRPNETVSGNVVIPSLIDGKKVIAVKDEAFSGCEDLTSVTIPDSVTEIGDRAFSGCAGLVSITIPDSVTSIGNSAFAGCSGLTSIIIPESVTEIGAQAFSGRGLYAIIVDENNPIFDSRDNCNAIIETATNTLVQGCSNTVIPDSVTSIGDYAFYDSSTDTITIPDSVTSIGNYAFYDSSIISITIPDSVTTFGSNSLPKRVTVYTYSSATEVLSYCQAQNINYVILDDDSIDYPVTGQCGENVFYELNDEGVLTISGTGDMYGYAVSSADQYSPNQAPYSQYKYLIKEVVVEEGVTGIDRGAFSYCSRLSLVSLPHTLTRIGSYAFEGCDYLASVTIPDSVTEIGNKAFYKCDNLVSTEIEGNNPKYDSRNNCNGIIETATNTLVQGFRNTVIPDSVTSIGNSAFAGMGLVGTYWVSSSIISIGSYAFEGNSSLKNIVVPDSVNEIDSTAFRVHPSITHTGFMPNEQELKKTYKVYTYSTASSVIDYCESNGINYTLLDGMCGENVSYMLKESGTLMISGTGDMYDYDTANNKSPFNGNESIKTATIENGVSSVGDNMFEGCDRLTSITIPDSVTSIGDGAFSNASNELKILTYSTAADVIQYSRANNIPYVLLDADPDNVITASGESGDSIVTLTNEAPTFRVTVPTILPVAVDSNNNVTVADNAAIVNYSNGAVDVTNAVLNTSAWSVVSFDSDFTKKAVNTKEYGFKINNDDAVDGIDTSIFDTIDGQSSLPFTYNANVAIQSDSYNGVDIGSIVFTVAWHK